MFVIETKPMQTFKKNMVSLTHNYNIQIQSTKER